MKIFTTYRLASATAVSIYATALPSLASNWKATNNVIEEPTTSGASGILILYFISGPFPLQITTGRTS